MQDETDNGIEKYYEGCIIIDKEWRSFRKDERKGELGWTTEKSHKKFMNILEKEKI